ncbi:hypothetical protein [Mucilaginibacter glaciei]|uniref:Uncharacterized protein n=1 Tax=Mucilaginibacter glaciei TaxID=2772109 RepID=A0A926S187_9SPHI|nr:hypothetical protein [Mucilaginibacter glaciei]MBD1391899.1 hypothetical protein [Mucilaginibacter glaciei]
MKYSLLFLFLLFGCHSDKVDNQLKPFVASTISDYPNGGIINFSNFEKVKWNKLYILGPYANPSFFDKTLTNYRSEIAHTGIEYSEDISLVLLFQDEELTSLNVIPRKQGDFSEAYKIGVDKKFTYYKKSEALFDFIKPVKGFTKFKTKK